MGNPFVIIEALIEIIEALIEQPRASARFCALNMAARCVVWKRHSPLPKWPRFDPRTMIGVAPLR